MVRITSKVVSFYIFQVMLRNQISAPDHIFSDPPNEVTHWIHFDVAWCNRLGETYSAPLYRPLMTLSLKVVSSAGSHFGSTKADLLGGSIPITAVLADQVTMIVKITMKFIITIAILLPFSMSYETQFYDNRCNHKENNSCK